jgi:2-dehydro-3-deoxyphosphogluconate aldolase / (4S)-4-hydroxy-2-oxoglutarate aldolase
MPPDTTPAPRETPSSIEEDVSAALRRTLSAAWVVAVLTLDRLEDAAPVAIALTAGGIGAVELTLRTPNALQALRKLREVSPGLLIGAGTVLNPEQAEAAKLAGADFALAPGLDVPTVRHCAQIGLPFIPGVATASEIQAALAAGCRLLKFFPAESLGGVRGLRTLATPFAHLGISYLPLGGIDLAKAAGYLAEPHVAAVGGSWIATPELIRNHAWDVIQQNARAATALVSATDLSTS